MVLIGSIIIVAGLGIVALACIGLYSYATEPREVIVKAPRTYSHAGAVRFQRIVKR